ncbi:hypothetical protein FRX31_021491 [Thalictrum thalictroides]|uniref:Reverse transcriptase zinc-binding domain-containing protein n=1 Tax=Thalictrum thalictroides TaxID=46969 RepID=A0A7J6VX82_THATH|nr:hypothetical protein FRX31_021491 [Thalictrum thalictroides]
MLYLMNSFKLKVYKVKVFVWCLIWGRTLTIDRLRRLGKMMPNRCSLCCKEEESITHLLLTCSFTKTVWEAFLNEVVTDGRTRYANGEVQECLKKWSTLNSSRWGEAVWKHTPYAILWAVWK